VWCVGLPVGQSLLPRSDWLLSLSTYSVLAWTTDIGAFICAATADKRTSIPHTLTAGLMVDAQGIEPWTSPV
jgi:hypothetical protein